MVRRGVYWHKSVISLWSHHEYSKYSPKLWYKLVLVFYVIQSWIYEIHFGLKFYQGPEPWSEKYSESIYVFCCPQPKKKRGEYTINSMTSTKSQLAVNYPKLTVEWVPLFNSFCFVSIKRRSMAHSLSPKSILIVVKLVTCNILPLCYSWHAFNMLLRNTKWTFYFHIFMNI